MVTNDGEMANDNDCISNLVKNSKLMSRIKRPERGLMEKIPKIFLIKKTILQGPK